MAFGRQSEGRAGMQVCLIRGLLDSPSIIRYGDQIVENLHAYHPEIQVTETRPPSPSQLAVGRVGRGIATQIVRYGWYPMRVKKIRADVVHIADHLHAHLVRRLPLQRTVITCHDLTTFVHPENITSRSLFPSLTTKLYQRALNRLHEAACVIAVSENTRKDILAYSRCVPEQVRVVYHGVDGIFAENADREKVMDFRRKFSPDGARLLLHVGLTTPYKNIESVLRVVHILAMEKRQNVRLIKVGQEFTPPQKQIIRRLGLDSRIVHLGRVERSELAVCYQSCDVLLFPSIYEGFGWPPLEAMSCGTPVVASTAGSIPEIAGDAALLEEPAAVENLACAVESLLTNDDLRKRLIAAGLRRARLFTWQRSVSQLASIYEDVSSLAPLR
jgi:glycosyltransferase involved in cell wall biosynthesis